MRQGIILDEGGDLAVQVIRNNAGMITGGLVVGESDGDHISLIIASNKGDFKEYPVLGVGEQYLKSVGRTSEIRADVQTQLELDGYKVSVQMDGTGKLVVDVE